MSSRFLIGRIVIIVAHSRCNVTSLCPLCDANFLIFSFYIISWVVCCVFAWKQDIGGSYTWACINEDHLYQNGIGEGKYKHI
jgi:hypothetical protein